MTVAPQLSMIKGEIIMFVRGNMPNIKNVFKNKIKNNARARNLFRLASLKCQE